MNSRDGSDDVLGDEEEDSVESVLRENNAWRHSAIETIGSGAIPADPKARYVQFGFLDKRTLLEQCRSPPPGKHCMHCERELRPGGVVPVVMDFAPYDALFRISAYCCCASHGLAYMVAHRMPERAKAWSRYFWVEFLKLPLTDIHIALPRACSRRYLGGTVDLEHDRTRSEAFDVIIQDSAMAPVSWIAQCRNQPGHPPLEQCPATTDTADPEMAAPVPPPTNDGGGGKVTHLRRPVVRTVPVATPQPTDEPPAILNYIAEWVDEQRHDSASKRPKTTASQRDAHAMPPPPQRKKRGRAAKTSSIPSAEQ